VAGAGGGGGEEVREEHALPVDRLLHGWKRGRDVGDRLWSLVLGCGELVMGLAAVLIEKGKEAVVCLDGCRGNVTQPRRVFVGYGAAMPCHGTFSDRIRPGISNGFWPYSCVLEMRFEIAIH
jgi:hypothetical protein